MGDRLRVGVRNAARKIGEQPLAYTPVVGGELGESEAVLLVGAEDHVDELGVASLCASKQLRVKAELQDEVGLRAAGELGVGDLVAPLTEVGGPIDAEEE